jgi:hypothetical protein
MVRGRTGRDVRPVTLIPRSVALDRLAAAYFAAFSPRLLDTVVRHKIISRNKVLTDHEMLAIEARAPRKRVRRNN